MSVIDLGGAPGEEACAQLGHTPDFARINRLEVAIYAAAMAAAFGPPPDGVSFGPICNRHDFGSYVTLGLKIAPEAEEHADVAAYVTEADNGLRSLVQAGFAPPIEYHDSVAVRVRSLEAAIAGAFQTVRPTQQHLFPVPEFERLFANLERAFPAEAERFRRSHDLGVR